jgi:hypothetical protein
MSAQEENPHRAAAHDHAVPRGRRPLIALLVVFGGLGALVQFAGEHGARVAPVSLPEEILPANVGAWKYVGSEPGWLGEGYPVGHTLFRYEQDDGSAMLVTGAVGQERYGTFSNLFPIFAQRGHETVGKIAQTVEGPAGKQDAKVTVSIYSGSQQERGFGFLGLFYDGNRLTTNLAATKITVTLLRAVGLPRPTVAIYFDHPMRENDDQKAVAADVAEFAGAFMPTVERLRNDYVVMAR